MEALNDIILNLGIYGIAIVIFIESAFPFGFFLPGDTLLFAAGMLAARGNFTIEYGLTVIFIANFVGVTVGYYLGKVLMEHWRDLQDGIFIKRSYIDKAAGFYARHGGKAIALGRFIPAVRSFIPIVAGVAEMSYKRLMVFNAIGAFAWVVGVGLIGYFSGSWLESRGINIEMLVLPIFAIIIALSFAAPIVHALRDKKSRESLLRKLRIKR
jgi:Uncharacterized membrane-associated protein